MIKLSSIALVLLMMFVICPAAEEMNFFLGSLLIIGFVVGFCILDDFASKNDSKETIEE